MANVQLQQALAQMRALAAEASAGARPQAAAPADDPNAFSGLLREALGTVNGLQQDASGKVNAFLRGEDVSLTEVMVASQKSRVAFEATKQVRNRLLEAYQEISRMQV
jgi:flagellar hook-basal body complex protein FliE